MEHAKNTARKASRIARHRKKRASSGAKHEEAQRLRDSLQPMLTVPKAKTGRELAAFFRASPLVEAELPVERERSAGRAAILG